MKISNDIERTINIWCNKNCVYEIRVPKSNYFGTISGYFNDFDSLCSEAEFLSNDPKIPAVYMTLNACDPNALARSCNTTAHGAKTTTKDHEIIRRSRVLIDCDPVRLAGISSSHDEHRYAIERADTIRKYLSSKGFPDPIFADSGNGSHLVYGIDLENNKASHELVESFLKHLAAEFNDEKVKVDISVSNASRINKLYGTMTRKGSNIPERPWRRSCILESPDKLDTVESWMLQLSRQDVKIVMPIKDPVPTSKTRKKQGLTPDSVESFMLDAGLKFRERIVYENGFKWQLEECPWSTEHTTGEDGAAVFLREGVIGFDCKHEHCKDRNVHDLFGDINKSHVSEKNGKYDSVAQAFLSHQLSLGKKFLFICNRMHFYTGTHYQPCDDISFMLRAFLQSRKIPQNNNLVSNVIPIVKSLCLKELPTNETLPFWDCAKHESPFVTNQNVIAFENGLFDLASERIEPHSTNWISTYCLPYKYDPKATCPNWNRFLLQVFDNEEDKVLLLQEFFGYCLTSDTSLQKALLLVGKPRSGKSTIQRILNALVGKHNATGFSLDRFAESFGTSALLNKSVALVGEVELSSNPNRQRITEILKSIIGEDEISINIKYQAELPSIRLPTRFVIAANSMPRLLDASGALAHRFLFISFNRSFLGKEDSELEKKLTSELSGIATWAIAGLSRLRKNGGRFTLGNGHKKMMNGYLEETASVFAWLESEVLVHHSLSSGDLPEKCLTEKILSVSKADAYLSFACWCEDRGIHGKDQSWFGKELKQILPDLDFSRNRLSNGTKVSTYQMIGLR